MAREKEKVTDQGPFLSSLFMVFKNMDESSSESPPERKVIPGTCIRRTAQ